MKFAIAKEHRDFFNKHSRIEFENFVAPEQLLHVNRIVDETLAERLHITPERIPFIPSESLYLEGHDLWRSNAELRKFVSQPRFAEIASELIEQKTLRLGYDQFLPARSRNTPPYESEQKLYGRFLDRVATLDETGSLEGNAVAFLICLNEPSGASETDSSEKEPIENEKKDIFPRTPGRAVFFKPSLSVDWSNLYMHKGRRYYLIVYTGLSAFYRLNPLDPHSHSLKHLGHLIDRPLTDKFNPVIRR